MKHFANRNNIDLNVVKATGKGGRVTKEDLINHMEGGSLEKVRSTPAVRAFAKQNNLDINSIRGTGNEGRVTRQDVMDFMSGASSTSESAETTSSSSSTGGRVGVPSGPPLSGIVEGDQRKKIVGIKKAMTKTMTQSLSIPTFTYSDDIDATKTMNLRKELKEHIPGITLLPFFIKALSLAMKEYPIVNSIVDPELDAEGYIKEYVMKKDHNYAVAIDSDHGLMTPNIKAVNDKSILGINTELRAMIEKT